MIQNYREDDGMDPGLGELAYDGAEYELYEYDEFGEMIAGEDSMDDDEQFMEEEPAAETEAMPASDATAAEGDMNEGFAETLTPDAAAETMTDATESAEMPMEGAKEAEMDATEAESMADADKSKEP